ncbi:hypothetical protein QNH28_09710 [Paenibacillus sp. G2S3]|nr:hypothetical protein [Paenibacillus sp. G2S3]WHY21235.1 hypothetical protein QNH28_09710 [Paenibacillus sp. G2S3]
MSNCPNVGLRGERLSYTTTKVSMSFLDCLTKLDGLNGLIRLDWTELG